MCIRDRYEGEKSQKLSSDRIMEIIEKYKDCLLYTSGAKTLLLERNAYLGGEATHSGVSAFCGFYSCGANPVKVVAGIGDLVLKEMEALGPTVDYITSATGNRNINFQPEYLKCARDNLLEREGVTCLLHARVIGTKVQDR